MVLPYLWMGEEQGVYRDLTPALSEGVAYLRRKISLKMTRRNPELSTVKKITYGSVAVYPLGVSVPVKEFCFKE
jgi:hypothetical protein